MYLRSRHIANKVSEKIDRKSKKEEVENSCGNEFENLGIVSDGIVIPLIKMLGAISKTQTKPIPMPRQSLSTTNILK